MQKSFLKFVCIFIIAMFCLTPLGAIDLNHDDSNNKYVNHKENETSSLVNVSNSIGIDINPVEDVDNDDSSDNKTNIVNVSDVNSSQVNLSKSWPNLNAHIDDVDYGEAPVVKVFADMDLYARVRMECPDFSYNYAVAIKDGYMKYQFQEYDLKPGTYVVKLYTIGDSKFDPQEITTKFNVNKIKPNFRINSIDSVVYGNNVVINVDADKRLNGTANIKLSNSKTVPIKFENGTGCAEIAKLHPGQYHAVVDYEGDDIFIPESSESTFRVYGDTNPELSVSIDDIQYGEHPIVKVHSNKSANGTVIIESPQFSERFSAQMENGDLEFEMPEINDLGNYTVQVSYSGDDIFMPYGVQKGFAVEKADPKLSIHVVDCCKSDSSVQVVIDADERFNGNVTVGLDQYVWAKEIEVVNGHGQANYPNWFDVGNHTARARTYGNEFFKAENCSSSYNVIDG